MMTIERVRTEFGYLGEGEVLRLFETFNIIHSEGYAKGYEEGIKAGLGFRTDIKASTYPIPE